jgi:hypothetical protein
VILLERYECAHFLDYDGSLFSCFMGNLAGETLNAYLLDDSDYIFLSISEQK